MMSFLPVFLMGTIAAYLIGSFPTGYVIGKLYGLGDIRKVGSGNIGATNMVRAGGKKLGALVLLVDAFKSAFGFWLSGELVSAVWLRMGDAGEAAAQSPLVVMLSVLVMLSVFLGHMFPVWLKFKGGKGISIMIGSLIGLPLIGVLAPVGFLPLAVYIGVWLGCYVLTRTSSLSGLTATLAVVTYFFFGYVLNRAAANSVEQAYVMEHLSMAVVYSFAALLVFYRHKDNIRRLLRGEELAFRNKEKEAV